MTDATVAIRKARPNDAPKVSALWETMADEHRAYDDEVWCWADDAVRHWREHFREVIQKPDMLLLVAEAAHGELVGFVIAQIRQAEPVFETRKNGFVWDLSVRPDWRRRGVASALVERAFEYLRARGVDDVILHVALDNAAAVAFYEAHGMRRVMYRMYRRL
ncbi:MAG: N-acetyltransferase family protein [Planctomycetota bacterium]